jgi:hypothetical protein
MKCNLMILTLIGSMRMTSRKKKRLCRKSLFPTRSSTSKCRNLKREEATQFPLRSQPLHTSSLAKRYSVVIFLLSLEKSRNSQENSYSKGDRSGKRDRPELGPTE